MKQKAAESALDEFGDLVTAKDFRFPPLGQIYCFHSSRPMLLVPAQGDSEAHFLHDITLLAPNDVCPGLGTSQSQ